MFEALCREISAVQRLAKIFEPSKGPRKETQLTTYDKMNGGGTFIGIYSNCQTVCGYKHNDCPHAKAKNPMVELVAVKAEAIKRRHETTVESLVT